MPIELKVPSVGESITEVEIGAWLKKQGDWVERDENVVVIETEKVSVEIAAPESGTLIEIRKRTGEAASVGDVVGLLEAGERAPAEDEGTGAPASSSGDEPATRDESGGRTPASGDEPSSSRANEPRPREAEPGSGGGDARVMPAARRALADAGLEASDVEPSGPGGRVLKEDVERARTASKERRPEASPAHREPVPPTRGAGPDADELEEIVPMTPLRRSIAERLVSAQQGAALLTTFNEADMSAVIALRNEFKDAFAERHGIKLGFMSFFVKAVVDALKRVPQVNAEVRGRDIVYKNHYDIGVAVGGGRGLVVPVVRGADRLSFAEVELAIADLARRARDNQLELSDLQGGTFTISNGGIYGSMLSTPIVNPPQSGILGLHAIKDRAVVVDGEIVARPMMYLALTYDHRIVDGREAVTFLIRVKDAIEQPARMLLEI